MHIIIADDQPDVRSALRLLLGQDAGTSLTEVVNYEALLTEVETDSPEIVLLDWELPGSSAGVIQALHAHHAGLAVIVLSSRPEMRHDAMAAGADAFVCKGDPPEELLTVIGKCRNPPFSHSKQ
ncbi:MAG: response regulator transcription factor [Dehalococcoidales bacterium]|nr:response regulator transcription factor [Dehalococcoidales bacterium]